MAGVEEIIAPLLVRLSAGPRPFSREAMGEIRNSETCNLTHSILKGFVTVVASLVICKDFVTSQVPRIEIIICWVRRTKIRTEICCFPSQFVQIVTRGDISLGTVP